MKIIIDRFEGEYAVCETEDKKLINIDKDLVPFDAKEGDILNIDGDIITLDTETTIKRKKDIDKLVDELWE
ncbi:DUF3006 domain-containing protein [Pseudobacteroides cellulosolvens]|uniref:DUF3006 domain-containing protein n=1 Tax=Pseudobacteroides cellulosolvens ATCC 35603 = DSM 2933 TaxID=398512 RepID=A0A0L6JNM7_9FIRM|nr:DUF3006 domain-containing protein [Pseudobacteroides cellulosolvens]KNY26957.1 Protein of unknown function DUF3006 [Pseudobacteroides cellulosolvens ATCC 35603 = DSM 2933]